MDTIMTSAVAFFPEATEAADRWATILREQGWSVYKNEEPWEGNAMLPNRKFQHVHQVCIVVRGIK